MIKSDRNCIYRFISMLILAVGMSILYSNLIENTEKSSVILILFLLVGCLSALNTLIFTIIDISKDGINDTNIFNIFTIIISGVVFLVTFSNLINPIIQFIISDYTL